jgi:alpha-D-ribose 1-methylphosphonate 5-phosphate C-P lyase
MSHHPSFRNRRGEPPCGSGAAAIRRAITSSKEVAVRDVMRVRYANVVMCMYVASFSPGTPNARADAEQALNLFFDGIEEEMTRLPPYTEGAEWDNRRKQLLGE